MTVTGQPTEPTSYTDPGDRYRATLLAVVMLAVTAFGSLMTIVTVALGSIADDLSTSRATLTWVITGLMLAMAVVTPIGGKLGDIHGHRTVFLIGLFGGVIATIACALAWNAGSLIVFRIAFGVFGALVIPNAQALMMHAYGPARRATAMGWFQFAMTGAPTIGIVLGGPLIDLLGWRAIFVVFAAVNAAALVTAALVLKPTPVNVVVRIDYAGAATLALAVLGALLAITRFTAGLRDGADLAAVTDPLGWLMVLFAVVGTVVFVRVERRSPAPMIALAYFRRRRFTLPMVSSAMMQFAYMGGFVVTPALLETRYGWTVGGIALLMAPRPGSFSAAAVLGGYLPQRVGQRVPIVVGSVFMVASMGAFTIAAPMTTGVGIGIIVVGLVLTGIAAGISQPSVSAMVVDAVDEADMGIANGMSQQMMFIGIVAGIQTMNVLVGDDASGSRFVATYLLGGLFAVGGLIAALAIPRPPAVRRP